MLGAAPGKSDAIMEHKNSEMRWTKSAGPHKYELLEPEGCDLHRSITNQNLVTQKDKEF